MTSVSASFESTLTEDKSQGWHVFSVSLFLLSVLLFLFDAFELHSINANVSLFADFEESESDSGEETPPPSVPKV